MISKVSSDSNRLYAELMNHSVRVKPKVRGVVRHWGHRLQTKVKANASTGHHRPGQPHIPGTGPGPNVATGDYRRGIGVEFFSSPLSDTAVVGTNDPQGRALEYGLPPDLPPYPHFGPALTWAERPFVVALGKAIDLDDR